MSDGYDIATVRDAYKRWGVNNATVPIGSVSRGSDVFMAFTGDSGAGLPSLSEQTASTIAAVIACVEVISGAGAVLPMNTFRRLAGGAREQLFDDPMWWMLNEQFHPRWSAAAGWEYLFRSRLLHGDAFAIIQRSPNGTVIGLKPVHPRKVEVYETPQDRLVYAVYPTNAAMSSAVEIYDQDDFMHVPGDGFDGIRTPSPLRYKLRLVGATAMATQEYAARFFANGARPDYALQSETSLTPEQFARLREQIDEGHLGVNKTHRPMLLESGLKFQAITMPLEDVQLLSTRQFQVEEVARVFGVPPFMIGHNEKTTSWGSGVEAMGTGFVRYTLRKHLHAFTNEINRKFFRTAGRFAEFDTTELERADTKTLFDAFSVALGGQGKPGFMKQNEVRRKLNLPEEPNGDTLETGMTIGAAEDA
jgi:HK97 family phage portal protein